MHRQMHLYRCQNANIHPFFITNTNANTNANAFVFACALMITFIKSAIMLNEINQ